MSVKFVGISTVVRKGACVCADLWDSPKALAVLMCGIRLKHSQCRCLPRVVEGMHHRALPDYNCRVLCHAGWGLALAMCYTLTGSLVSDSIEQWEQVVLQVVVIRLVVAWLHF